MTQLRHTESSQQQDARKPASEVAYWEDIMLEAMEAGDQERYEMAKERAYGTEEETSPPVN